MRPEFDFFGRSMLLGAAVLVAVATAAGATTEAQLCATGRLKVTQIYAACRLGAAASAAKRGESPDYSRCETGLESKYALIDEKFCASQPADPSAAQIVSVLDPSLDAVSDAAVAAVAPAVDGAGFCGTGTSWDATSSTCLPTDGGGGGGGGGGGWTGMPDCAADTFLDLAQMGNAGPGYPAPQLNASCNGTTVTVQSNGIPTYTFVQITPNALQARSNTFTFTQNPVLQATTRAIPLLGMVAATVTGLPIYGANEAAFPDPYGDPIANGVLDTCGGHTGPAGDYHNHELFETCLTLDGSVDPAAPSPIIAWAFDGFPIYGSRGCTDSSCTQVVTFKSGWDATNTGTLDCTSDAQCTSAQVCALAMVGGVERNTCISKTYAWNNNAWSDKGGLYLDRCNGRTQPDGSYGYHATSTFPYTLGCYHG